MTSFDQFKKYINSWCGGQMDMQCMPYPTSAASLLKCLLLLFISAYICMCCFFQCCLCLNVLQFYLCTFVFCALLIYMIILNIFLLFIIATDLLLVIVNSCLERHLPRGLLFVIANSTSICMLVQNDSLYMIFALFFYFVF